MYHRHHHHNRGVLALTFGDVAFGYNDGYWDNNHSWHRWSNDGEYRNYRQHGSNYHVMAARSRRRPRLAAPLA